MYITDNIRSTYFSFADRFKKKFLLVAFIILQRSFRQRQPLSFEVLVIHKRALTLVTQRF